MTTEERLEKVEQELARANRRNRWVLAAVGLLLVVGIIGWAFRPEPARAQPAGSAFKEVRANRFILEDERGKTRAELAVTKYGPVLSVFDERGTARAELGVDKNGPVLYLSDEKGNPRAGLTVDKDMAALLYLYDEKGKPRAGLTVLKDGPGLALFDEKGKPRAGLAVDKDRPGLYLSDEKGVRVGLAVLKDEVGLRLYDEKGVRAALGRGSASSPDGTKIHYPDSSLRLFGPDGTVVWSAP